MANEPEKASQDIQPSRTAEDAAVLVPPVESTSHSPSLSWLWDKIKRHKVAEWTLAYVAFSYAFLHGAELLSDAQEWPHVIVRVLSLVLVLGVPIVATLAWFHGHRAQHRVSRVELFILIVLLCAAGVVLWFLSSTGHEHDVSKETSARSVAALKAENPNPISAAFAPPAHSIAVLPFTNLSGDPNQEYFSDGISEELINALANIDALEVSARTSSFSFKGQNVDIATIARKLNVGAVLEGSIRRSGNTVRITAQLINTINGFHLWSQDYDRDLKNILALQSDIATTVAQQMQVMLVGTKSTKTAIGGTHNPDAYDAYLLGLHVGNQGNAKDYRRAISLQLRATQLDPGFAEAYAALAIDETNLAGFTADIAGFKRAQIAAEKALVLEPALVGGYRARAVVRENLLDFPGYRADTEKAFQLDARKSEVQIDYAIMLATFGRASEGAALLGKTIQIDSLNYAAWGNLGSLLYYLNDLPGARRAIDQCLAISPRESICRTISAGVALREGKYDDALREYQNCGIAGEELLGAALVEYSRGNDRSSQHALKQLINEHAADAAYQIAEAFSWRGEKDRAFDWLERAYNQRDNGLYYMTFDPLVANLQSDPRFDVMLRRLKLKD